MLKPAYSFDINASVKGKFEWLSLWLAPKPSTPLIQLFLEIFLFHMLPIHTRYQLNGSFPNHRSVLREIPNILTLQSDQISTIFCHVSLRDDYEIIPPY